MPGKYVPLKETLRGFRMILNGGGLQKERWQKQYNFE